MTTYDEISAHSAEIANLCRAVGLRVDSIDKNGAGVFTVCFYPDGFSLDTTLAALRYQQRRRATDYQITGVYDGKLPIDRLEFRNREGGGG